MANAGESNAHASGLSFEPDFLKFTDQVQIIALLNGFISVPGATALSMEEFHPTSSSLASTSEGLLCSSIITAVMSAVICIMLLFRFEGAEKATQGELLLAWVPLVLLDISVIDFLVGLVCWYLNRHVS
jgi:hypothetical protein